MKHESETVLEVLEEISEGRQVTQRKISRRLGISLGRTNALLRQLIDEQFVAVEPKSNNRFSYSLTESGDERRCRGAVTWLAAHQRLLRRAVQVVGEKLQTLVEQGHDRAVCLGTGPLLEAVLLAAAAQDFEIVAIVDADTETDGLYGLPVLPPGGAASMPPAQAGIRISGELEWTHGPLIDLLDITAVSVEETAATPASTASAAPTSNAVPEARTESSTQATVIPPTPKPTPPPAPSTPIPGSSTGSNHSSSSSSSTTFPSPGSYAPKITPPPGSSLGQ